MTVGEAPTSETWIVMAPESWGELSEEGRIVVLTHECVHVALAAGPRPRAPRWLVEGVADDLAYRRSTVPVEAVLAPLRRDVAVHGAPRHLPRDEEFEVAGAGRDAVLLAYAQALSAVRTYADLHGEDAAVDLVRGRAGGGGVDRVPLEQGLLPVWRQQLERGRPDPTRGSDRPRPGRRG
ncbi:hypothetical protein [Mobilicoccus pelagius]|uniref:hypothetical protein n=1 Tax=Mobilicoccus pelagius TaxID=746032 RepID=UPI0011471693|nr:hypothetical protein [Mobilicoccus pelagius]